MGENKKVGYLQAKRLFHQRPLKSQYADRQRTSKNLVYPLSKNSYKWAKDQQRYDMAGIDTKTRQDKTIIQGKLYSKYENAPSLQQAKIQQKEILAGFSRKMIIPECYPLKQLQESSAINVQIKKKGINYGLYYHPKKNRFPFVHPVIIQKKHEGKRRKFL